MGRMKGKRPKSDMISILQSMRKLARDLSKSYLIPQYEKDQTLKSLISSIYKNLQECMFIINGRAPVRRLPADVLDLIFHTVLQDDPALPQIPVENAPTSLLRPLALSHVSQFWRSTAIQLPLLWTVVRITAPWNLHLIKTCLSRSKQCPIALTLTAGYDINFQSTSLTIDVADDARSSGIYDLWNTIAPHIFRCRRISVHLGGEFRPLFLSIRYGIRTLHMPFLENMIFVGNFSKHNHRHISERSTVPVFTQGAPSLTEIRVNAFVFLHCRPPLEQLTSLHLRAGQFTTRMIEFSDTLVQCQALETLAIYNNISKHWANPPVPLPLPSLLSLQFHGEFFMIEAFFHAILAPLLNEVIITVFDPDDWSEVPQLPLIFPNVKTLGFSPDPINDGGSIHLASRLFPGTENLTLLGEVRLLELCLRDYPFKQLLWPRLRGLSLRVVPRTRRVLEDPLSEFVISRKSAGFPLEEIGLNDASSLPTAQLQRLEEQVRVIDLGHNPTHDEQFYG